MLLRVHCRPFHTQNTAASTSDAGTVEGFAITSVLCRGLRDKRGQYGPLRSVLSSPLLLLFGDLVDLDRNELPDRSHRLHGPCARRAHEREDRQAWRIP